jgi:hypothetical protein
MMDLSDNSIFSFPKPDKAKYLSAEPFAHGTFKDIFNREFLVQVAAEFPDFTVRRFIEELPALRDSHGYLAPAERATQIASLSTPVKAVSIIALGALRSRDLKDDVLLAFQGRTVQEVHQELGPAWFMNRIQDWMDRPLREFARDLACLLVNRSQRIALRKASRDRKTGSLRVPSRVHIREPWIVKDSNEGAGSVGLRWDQIASVLAEAGVVERRGGTWSVTSMGDHVLS